MRVRFSWSTARRVRPRLRSYLPQNLTRPTEVDAKGRLYVGCGDGVHILSRDGELLGKIKLPGKDPAANLAFGKGKHKSTLYVLDETSVTAVELPGTRGARVGRERKFDVGRVRYKST